MADAVKTTAPATAAATPNPENKPAKERGPGPGIFSTADEAMKEATSREKGHRRAFKVTVGDKDYFTVAHNPHLAASFIFETKLKGTVTELGKTGRAKMASVDAVVAALAALPPEERAKVEALLGGMKEKADNGTAKEPAKAPAGKKS